jgi:carboxypeptidase Taq
LKIRDNYIDLLRRAEEIHVLDQISWLLDWDFQTYIPPKAINQRAQQKALLATLIHEKKTQSEIGELIKSLKNDPDYATLNMREKRNIDLIERDYNRLTRVPKELTEQIEKQSTIATDAWKKAKAANDYPSFQPHLGKLLELVKKRAHLIDPSKEPIDVMLDEYAPGYTSELVTKLFNQLKKGLIPLVQKCVNSPHQPDISILRRHCPRTIQEELAQDVSQVFCYDFDRGRIDSTEHPFASGFYDDVRVTTHYTENDFTDSFFGVIHEAGHAIYNQNLPREFRNQPIGLYCLGGTHESQSRFLENIIGRSKEFWEFYFPRFTQLTGDLFVDVDPLDFIHAINTVIPSKIRVTADEVTYSLHVIIRFEIERDLLNGTLKTTELPEVWNTKYKEYLGLDITNDAEGVLQDIHWASGFFGGFSFYVIGNMYNSQMLQVILKEMPEFFDLIKQGNLRPIIEWLKKHVHQVGNQYDPEELLKRISGEEINPKYFLQYLKSKYSQLYQFDESK